MTMVNMLDLSIKHLENIQGLDYPLGQPFICFSSQEQLKWVDNDSCKKHNGLLDIWNQQIWAKFNFLFFYSRLNGALFTFIQIIS